jgi:hypothetical protein
MTSVIEVIIRKLVAILLRSVLLKPRIGAAPKRPKRGAVIRAILAAFK